MISAQTQGVFCIYRHSWTDWPVMPPHKVGGPGRYFRTLILEYFLRQDPGMETYAISALTTPALSHQYTTWGNWLWRGEQPKTRTPTLPPHIGASYKSPRSETSAFSKQEEPHLRLQTQYRRQYITAGSWSQLTLDFGPDFSPNAETPCFWRCSR